MTELAAGAASRNKEMAREFLHALDPAADQFTFQFIGDTRRGRSEIVHGSIDDVWPKIEQLNTPASQIGVFVTPNKTDLNGRKAENVTEVRSLFADADGQEQVEHCETVLAARQLTPSMVVKTGRGKHYYFLAEVPCEEFSDYQQCLIDNLGTDPTIKDLPRVMRLPGTLHLKDPSHPKLVRLEAHIGERPRFSAPELRAALGASGARAALTSGSSPLMPRPTAASPAPSSPELFTVSEEAGLVPCFAADPAVQQLLRNAVDRLSDGIQADVEEIRSAAFAIPSSALASEHGWVRVARALAHEAAVYPASERDLWALLDQISRAAPRYDQEENRRRWVRYQDEAFDKKEPITKATLFRLARDNGWSGHVPLPSRAPAIAAAKQFRAVSIANLPAIPKKREWLCGIYAMRGAVTLLTAPGGRGKTAWLVTLAISSVSGKTLLGAHLYGGPKTVLYLSVEEGTAEINLRVRAAMQHHGIGEADLANLYVIGAEGWGMPLVRIERGTPCLHAEGWAQLEAELDRVRPDMLIAEPVINLFGGADTNSNSVVSLLMAGFVRLATQRNMAIVLAHHAAKGRDPTAAESAMGGISIVNLSRISLSIDQLQEKDAATVGLPPWEAKSVFRVIGTKQNYTPASSENDWFRLVSVEVPNARPPTYPHGDNVGVVERFVPGAAGQPPFDHELLRSALATIAEADPPLTPSARSHARHAVPAIARAIAPHRAGKISDAEAKAVLGHLTDTGLAAVERRKIPRAGGRSDERNVLVVTPTGAELLSRTGASPQSPQSPATVNAGDAADAGGDPLCGSPATQGGYGGECGGVGTGAEQVRHVVPQAAQGARRRSRGRSAIASSIVLSVGEPDGLA